MIKTTTGTLRRVLTASELEDVTFWLTLNPLCIKSKTLSTGLHPRETFLSIKKWFDYDSKLSDKQLITLKKLYLYRDKTIEKQLEKQLEKQRLGSS